MESARNNEPELRELELRPGRKKNCPENSAAADAAALGSTAAD